MQFAGGGGPLTLLCAPLPRPPPSRTRSLEWTQGGGLQSWLRWGAHVGVPRAVKAVFAQGADVGTLGPRDPGTHDHTESCI